ncbi:DNA polymerase III subunit alpha [Actinomadura fibrosa]|uniref:DNA-directed DNA polymerase n=1 Tax=Actinomadura fibrosa TaxID=111802 RepID=A0ABW2XSA3_9ACTN|nr:DNA polymerase III subunit alpha [Actinomadura fibrosa]
MHLHVASAYSLRYGVAPPGALAARAAELGMETLALTDRDGLYGAVRHVLACRDAGLGAIVGTDLAMRAADPPGGGGVSSEGDPSGGGALPSGGGLFSGGGVPGGGGLLGGGDLVGGGGLLGGGGHSGAGGHLAWGGHFGGGGVSGGGDPSGRGGFPGGGDPFGWGGVSRASGSGGSRSGRRDGRERVVVLAVGRSGWRSLCRLVTAAHEAGGRGRPVGTRAMVGAHAEGLVVLLGPASDVGRAVAARRPDVAARRLAAWRETADTVVEIVDHRGPGDGHRAARMLALAREAGCPAVLTNAVRYLEPADHPVAQVLDVTRRLVPLDRRHLDDTTGQAYLKSVPEMRRIAELSCGPDRDAAAALLAATRLLSERCVLDPGRDLGMDAVHLPAAGGDPQARLAARCAEGLARRGLDRSRRAADRLARELGVIARKGFASYFLTVADAAALIRARGIRCAIRGSGAGSLVNHLLGIGDLDPLRHDLLMERFLADSREGLPDIDLDVESARRLEAYRALFERFGEAGTACVSMMETYRARSAIRDVGNAVGLPPQEIDAVAKAFPRIRASRIRAALDELPELRQSNLAKGRLEVLFRIAERLDGLPRHIAMHPCGVLLSNPTLRDRTPVEPSALGFPMSQFDKVDVEAMGLLKLDVIGVRMQSAMAHAVAEVARVTGERIDLEAVPRDDPATFALIRTSRTLGCFQIESPGQRDLLGRLQPRGMDDLVVDISLFRPGPVSSDMVAPFLAARAGTREPDYPHPDLVPALRESLGVVVFHEQVLRVLDVMTGCGLSQAEAARRGLGDERGQAVVGAWFRGRALARGYDGPTVERVWRTFGAFGAFGFCKAHAASFALPTYQSAWLKRHHTAAFYAGVLTHDPGMYPKRVILDDARHFGVPILPLDVNHSDAAWHVEPVSEGGTVNSAAAGGSAGGDTADGAVGGAVAAGGVTGRPGALGIRVALNEVRGISEAEVGRIVAGRPYGSLADFWRRARVSRPVAERLALVGAFDSLHRPPVPRRDLLCRVGALDRATSRPGRGAVEGQLPLGHDGENGPTDLASGFVETIPAGELPPMTPAEIVEAELDILGMDVSRHVLAFYDELLADLGVVRAADLPGRPGGSEVLVAGVKVATQTPAVRSGRRVIFATLDDATGPVDLAFFESVQDRCAATLFGCWLLLVRGRVRHSGASAVSVTASACWDLLAVDEERRRGGPAVRRPPDARLWHASEGSSGPPPN